jgi:hypothetical protein
MDLTVKNEEIDQAGMQGLFKGDWGAPASCNGHDLGGFDLLRWTRASTPTQLRSIGWYCRAVETSASHSSS